MTRMTHHIGDIPKKELFRAVLSWLLVIIPYSIGWALTFIMGLLVAATSKKQTTHPQGKDLLAKHEPGYIKAGSSGKWEYRNSNWKICKWWNNLEDGTLGEPSGKHSARCGGNERSFLNQYLWTIRNPFNYGKRTIPLFYCPIDDCAIEYWGDLEVTDKEYGPDRWHFCKATNIKTGKVYYWYRSVKFVSRTKVKQAAIGFKFKPTHALVVQDVDDKDKAFTLRLPVTTNVD